MIYNLLEKIKDIYKGRTAFIAGSGPSLRHIEPERLKGHIVIAINGAILKVPEADYFFSCDGRVTLTRAWQNLKNLSCTLILDQTYSGFNSYDYKEPFVKSYEGIADERLCFFKRDKNNPNVMRDDNLLLLGSSSAHSAAHFAYLLGCSPIVLLGMDCGLENGKRLYNEFEGQPEDGIFKPEWEIHILREGNEILGAFFNTWVEIAENNPNARLINCGQGVFPGIEKMTLEEVLKG